MVFISFPQSTSSEEENLLKKYEKLERKRKSLEKAANPEPEIVKTTFTRSTEAKDAKKVIEALKKSGQLPQIIANQSKKAKEFKRKIPKSSAARSSSGGTQRESDDEQPREVVSYDDDLFS